MNFRFYARRHRERKCADTIGTVLVPWAGHFQLAKTTTTTTTTTTTI